jgi:hypothetical protein
VETCFDQVAGGTFKGGLDDSTYEPHEIYFGCLYEYSGRNLSFDFDVVDAFTGIQQVILRRMAGDVAAYDGLICGLPSHLFDWAILWDPDDILERRHCELPSWSWCGWKGTISVVFSQMTYSQVQEWIQQRTWIKWTIHGKDVNGVDRVLCIDYNQQRENLLFPSKKHPPVDLGQPTMGNKPQLMEGSISPQHALLHFATLSIDLFIHCTDIIRGPWRLYKICDVEDIVFGYIWLGENKQFDPKTQFRFLALSEAHSARFQHVVTLERAKDWDAYNAMMIQRVSETEQTERIGLGIILKQMMNEDNGARWRKIWLR